MPDPANFETMDDVLAGRRRWAIVHADVREGLKQLPDNSVHTICTSPPYWQKRAYATEPQDWADGWEGELGAEPDPSAYVAHMVEVGAQWSEGRLTAATRDDPWRKAAANPRGMQGYAAGR